MLIVVGGHSRNIGKTSVVCGIIEALPEFAWTAIKITQYGHHVCSKAGEPCECADPKHPVGVSEERGDAPGSDSGRFLAAGARRAFWVRTPGGRLGEAMRPLRKIVEQAGNAIVESNSVLQFLRPDACFMVVDGAVADFKASSRRFLDRATGLVATSDAPMEWEGVPGTVVKGLRLLRAPGPGYRSDELIGAIREIALKVDAGSADITYG